MRVYLSPSDQWSNPYAAGSTSEAAQMGRVAAAAAAALQRNGITVRVGDNAREGSYPARVADSNNWGANLHVPLHSNAGASGRGAEVYCAPHRVDNPYVVAVYTELNQVTPSPGRGIKATTSLFEVNATNAVTIYPEVEFHDKPDLAAWIIANTTVIGEAIAKGIVKAAGGTWNGATPPKGDAEAFTLTTRKSPNGRVALIQQGDGNTVVTKDGWPTHATMLLGPGHKTYFQADGNFVIYNTGGKAIGDTETAGKGHRLAVQDDGNIVIYDKAGKPVWGLWGVPGAYRLFHPVQTSSHVEAIMGEATLSATDLVNALARHNVHPLLACTPAELARLFLAEGAVEGVRGDVAFFQACKETGWFTYGGQVLPEQNNYAGIGATNNSPVGKGAWFDTPQTGVRAQIQHLKAYASTLPLTGECVDPRFGLVARGVAPTWPDLNGRWAVPGPTYGQDILAMFAAAR